VVSSFATGQYHTVGTRLDEEDGMDETEGPTVEQSLEVLSAALGKATEDLSAVRAAVDRVRVDMSAHNGSHSRTIIRDAERAVTHLRETEESLKDVLKDLTDAE
jgi:cob(I)alamin adenosyltransferase